MFLESSQIPYFGYLGRGVVFPFFKDKEEGKRDEVVKFIKKTKAKPSKYGIGLTRKDFLDSFEKKVIQRVKLRYDPFWKLKKGKVIDSQKKELEEEGLEREEDKQGDKIDLPEKLHREEIGGVEIKERLEDYENTFKSELIKEKKEKLEELAKNVPREINEKRISEEESPKQERKFSEPESVDYTKIQDVMTNKYSSDNRDSEEKKEEENDN